VDVLLSVEGVGLEELSEWLGQEPELRGLVSVQCSPAQAGQLGPLAEVLVAAVGAGGALSVLMGSLKVFLSQPRHTDVRIVVSTPDGRRVEIDAKRVPDAESLVRQALERPE
jgi:hypothetical protein